MALARWLVRSGQPLGLVRIFHCLSWALARSLGSRNLAWELVGSLLGGGLVLALVWHFDVRDRADSPLPARVNEYGKAQRSIRFVVEVRS
jgi:hypothetical protein